MKKVLFLFDRTVRRLAREMLRVRRTPFDTSANYWKRVYQWGGHSGKGSRGMSAAYKARFINSFCRQHHIGSVVDIGCGDGQNASLLDIPRYLGLDISAHALSAAEARCTGKRDWYFAPINGSTSVSTVRTLSGEITGGGAIDLVMSMDVIYHLVEDDIYEQYLRTLAGLCDRFLVIYATNFDGSTTSHVRHRRYVEHLLAIDKELILLEQVPNPLYPGDVNMDGHFCVFQRGGVPNTPPEEMA